MKGKFGKLDYLSVVAVSRRNLTRSTAGSCRTTLWHIASRRVASHRIACQRSTVRDGVTADWRNAQIDEARKSVASPW